MGKVKKDRVAYETRLNRLFDTYSRVMFVTLDNVTSQQIHDVRRQLRGKAEMIAAKKTMLQRIISIRADRTKTASDVELKKIFVDDGVLAGNVGLMFTNEDVAAIEAVTSKYRKQAPARVGAIAPCEVIIPAISTGLEPTQTNFFQALNIATKITKGVIEIVNEKKVLNAGDKVDSSTAALLQKLKISPFFYQLEIKMMYEGGILFSKEDLAVTDASLEESLIAGINKITAISLGAGIPTEASFPHLVLDAFKTLLAVSVETNFVFTEFDGKNLRDSIKSGKATGPSKEKAPVKAEAKPVETKKPVVETKADDDDDFSMDGLF